LAINSPWGEKKSTVQYRVPPARSITPISSVIRFLQAICPSASVAGDGTSTALSK